MSTKMEPIPDYGEHMTLYEWYNCVHSGLFIDDDGYGCLATKDEMSQQRINPSDLGNREIEPKYTHIVWFNR